MLLHIQSRMRAVRCALVLFAVLVPFLTTQTAFAGPLAFQSELVTPGLTTYNYDGGAVAISTDGITAIIRALGKTQNTGTAYAFSSLSFPPTVTAVSPGSGPLAGENPATITGANFQVGATVSFGGVPATGVVRVSATQLTAIVPSFPTSATVAITVTNYDGNMATFPQSYGYVNAVPPMYAAPTPIAAMTPRPAPATHTPARVRGATTPTPLPAPVRY